LGCRDAEVSFCNVKKKGWKLFDLILIFLSNQEKVIPQKEEEKPCNCEGLNFFPIFPFFQKIDKLREEKTKAKNLLN
jgi:hypothetical protein